MKIDSHQTIAGHPIRKIRDFLRFAGGSEFTAESVAKRIGVDVAAQLVSEGLIEPTQIRPRDGLEPMQLYRATNMGKRLALARFNRRVGRGKAEEIVAAFLQRVEAINSEPDLLLRVVRVDAFGSYITDAVDLGDIDLAIELERKSFPGHDWVDLNFARARASGRSLTFLQQLYYAHIEVTRRLQNRNCYLSLHAFDELAQLGCEHRQIFPPPPSHGLVPRPRRKRPLRNVRRRGDRPTGRPSTRRSADVRRSGIHGRRRPMNGNDTIRLESR